MLCRIGLHRWAYAKRVGTHNYCSIAYHCLKYDACNRNITLLRCTRCGRPKIKFNHC